MRVSLSQHKTQQRAGGYTAVTGGFAFDLAPQTTSATTSVNSAINVGGSSGISTIDLFNVTSDRVYITQMPKEEGSVSLSRDDKELVLGLSIGIPAAAVVVMVVVLAMAMRHNNRKNKTIPDVQGSAAETLSLLQTVSSSNV